MAKMLRSTSRTCTSPGSMGAERTQERRHPSVLKVPSENSAPGSVWNATGPPCAEMLAMRPLPCQPARKKMAVESGNQRICGSNAGSPASLSVDAIRQRSVLAVRQVVVRAAQSCTKSSTFAVPYMLSVPVRPAHAMRTPSGLHRGCDLGPLGMPVMRDVRCLPPAPKFTRNSSDSEGFQEARGSMLPATTSALPSGAQSHE